MQVTPGIHRIEAPLGERIVCVYLLIGDERIMLIDTGLDSTPGEFVEPYLRKLGEKRDVDYVLTTHGDFDHFGGNAAARKLWPKACFMAHRLDADWIQDTDRLIRENYGQFDAEHGTKSDPKVDDWIRSQTRATAIDVELAGGERVRLGGNWWVEILHTPGHTRGHVSVLDPRGKHAIIADSALADALYTVSGAAVFPPTYRFVDEYLKTARELMAWGPDLLLSSHYPVMRGGESNAFLQKTIDYVDRVEREVFAELNFVNKPVKTLELIDRLMPRLGKWPESGNAFFIYPLVGHLERLEERKRISSLMVDGVRAYQTK